MTDSNSNMKTITVLKQMWKEDLAQFVVAVLVFAAWALLILA